MTEKACVVDSSFVAAFVLQEAEGSHFERVLAKGWKLHVPGLFFYEIANVLLMALRRKRISLETAGGLIKDISCFGLQNDLLESPAKTQAIFSLADQYSLTFYDASYLELAIRQNLQLKTLDHDLLRLKKRYPCISDT